MCGCVCVCVTFETADLQKVWWAKYDDYDDLKKTLDVLAINNFMVVLPYNNVLQLSITVGFPLISLHTIQDINIGRKLTSSGAPLPCRYFSRSRLKGWDSGIQKLDNGEMHQIQLRVYSKK